MGSTFPNRNKSTPTPTRTGERPNKTKQNKTNEQTNTQPPKNFTDNSYLVFAEEREVEEDLQRLGVGSQNDDFCCAAVQRLGRLVGALLELLVVGRLLDQIEDRDRQARVRQRGRLRVHTGVSGLRWCVGRRLCRTLLLLRRRGSRRGRRGRHD